SPRASTAARSSAARDGSVPGSMTSASPASAMTTAFIVASGMTQRSMPGATGSSSGTQAPALLLERLAQDADRSRADAVQGEQLGLAHRRDALERRDADGEQRPGGGPADLRQVADLLGRVTRAHEAQCATGGMTKGRT